MSFMRKISMCLMAFYLTGCLMTRNEMEEVQQKKVMQDQVVNLQKNNADQQSRYNDINSELRELNGKIEALENRILLMQQDRERTKKENDATLTETNKKVAALQEEVMKLESQLLSVAADTQAKASVEKSSADTFDTAEEHYSKKEWKKAIFNYQKYREANPKSKKLADATLKIGISFQELGMKEEAKTFLDEVVNKYPQSAAAKIAKTRIKKLK